MPVYFVTDDSISHFILAVEWEPVEWMPEDSGVVPVNVFPRNQIAEWTEFNFQIFPDQRRILVEAWADSSERNFIFTDGRRMLGFEIEFLFEDWLWWSVILQSRPYDIGQDAPLFRLAGGEIHFAPGAYWGILCYGCTDPVDNVSISPGLFSLSNYPNPFNSSTNINFMLPEAGHVKLGVFDVAGRLVNTLIDADIDAGLQTVIWDGTDESGRPISSGIYFYTLRSDNDLKSHRMLLLK